MFREGKDNPPKNDGGKEVKSPESREAKKLEDKVSSLESVYKKANDAPSPREEKQKLYTNEYAKQVDEAKASVGQALRNIEKKKNNLNEKDPKYLQKLGKLNKQEAQYKSAEARLTKIQKDVNPALAERNNEKAVAKVSKICQDVDSGKKKCYTHEDRQQAKKAEKDIQNTYQNINSERKSLQKSDPDYASKMKDLDARAQTCENQLQKVQAASEKMRDAQIQEKTVKNKEASDKVKEKGGNELRHYPEGTEDKLKDTMDKIQESMDYLKQEKSRLEKTEPKDTQKLKELDKQLDKRQEQLEDTKAQLEDYRNAYIDDVLKDCQKYDKKIDNAWNPDAKQERLYSEKTEQRIETAEQKAQESLDQLKQEQAALQKERAALVEKAEKSDPKPEQADSKEPAKTENPDAKDPSKTEKREGADTEDIKKKLSPEDAAKLDALDKQLEKVDKAIGDRQDQLDKLQDHADKAREAQIDKHYDDLIKVRDKGNQVGESEAKGEKHKLYTADVAKDVNAAVDRLEAYVDHLKEKQAALDQKEPDKNEPVDQRVEEKRKLDHEIKKREGQLAELRPLAQEVADIREDKRLSENQKPFEAVYDQFNKTPPPSPEQKRELYSHDFIDAAQAQRDAVAQRYEQVDSRMKDLEKNNQTDTPEYYRLKGERFERGRDLASMDIILKDAKNFEYNSALEMGEERYCAEMGKSKLEQKWELKKDQECVRNHRVVSHRLEQERAKAVEARNGVEGELLVMRNQYGLDDLNKMPEYKDLCDRHNKLDDVIGTYDAQIRHLDQQCDRLQDKHGKDEYGEYILSIKSTELQLPDGKADQAVADLVDRVNVDHAGKGLTAGECAKTLNVLEDVNRNVIPALTQQITDLTSQLEGAKAYCAENPQDKMMASYPAQLEKELAKKTQQLSCLTEGSAMLQTEMHTSDLHHSAALHYHSDGTWSVVQNWTNAEDKIHSAKNFESKSRLYANTYQRTSTVRFDENGDAIAKSFGFQYKAVGVYSECQLGGKNLNIQNVFDGSLLNASASVGYNKEAHGMGVFAKASASVAEISNQASLNMLNKQVFQVSAEASLAKASAKAGLEGGLPAVSFSANAGLEASVEASVGKLKVFTAEYSALTHEVKGSLNIPDLIDGKTAENVLQVNHEPGSKTSHAFGDVITIFQQENANGQITSRTFLNDFKDLFETAGGRAQLAEQMGKIADIQENGILDDVKADDKITVQSSRKPDHTAAESTTAAGTPVASDISNVSTVPDIPTAPTPHVEQTQPTEPAASRTENKNDSGSEAAGAGIVLAAGALTGMAKAGDVTPAVPAEVPVAPAEVPTALTEVPVAPADAPVGEDLRMADFYRYRSVENCAIPPDAGKLEGDIFFRGANLHAEGLFSRLQHAGIATDIQQTVVDVVEKVKKEEPLTGSEVGEIQGLIHHFHYYAQKKGSLREEMWGHECGKVCEALQSLINPASANIYSKETGRTYSGQPEKDAGTREFKFKHFENLANQTRSAIDLLAGQFKATEKETLQIGDKTVSIPEIISKFKLFSGMIGDADAGKDPAVNVGLGVFGARHTVSRELSYIDSQTGREYTENGIHVSLGADAKFGELTSKPIRLPLPLPDDVSVQFAASADLVDLPSLDFRMSESGAALTTKLLSGLSMKIVINKKGCKFKEDALEQD